MAELEERMRGSMERLEQQLTEMTGQIQAERERRKAVEQRWVGFIWGWVAWHLLCCEMM